MEAIDTKLFMYMLCTMNSYLRDLGPDKGMIGAVVLALLLWMVAKGGTLARTYAQSTISIQDYAYV